MDNVGKETWITDERDQSNIDVKIKDVRINNLIENDSQVRRNSIIERYRQKQRHMIKIKKAMRNNKIMLTMTPHESNIIDCTSDGLPDMVTPVHSISYSNVEPDESCKS